MIIKHACVPFKSARPEMRLLSKLIYDIMTTRRMTTMLSCILRGTTSLLWGKDIVCRLITMLILPWYLYNSGFRIDPVEPHGQRTSTTRHRQDPTLIIHGREWCASPSLEMPMWSCHQAANVLQMLKGRNSLVPSSGLFSSRTWFGVSKRCALLRALQSRASARNSLSTLNWLRHAHLNLRRRYLSVWRHAFSHDVWHRVWRASA